jgi:glycosyltransferase involved in cell wall biosynthesis
MALSVSVALCTFNSADFLVEQVRSILSQPQPPGELVVADDGSVDATHELLLAAFERYGSPRTELRWLAAQPQPLGVARNFERALLATSGDLVALSDHDDVWHDDRLARSTELFEVDPDLLLLHSDARLVDAVGHPLGLGLFEALGVSARERAELESGRAFDTYIRRNLATGATVMLRRSLLDFAVPFGAGWVHDEWLAIVAAAVGRVQVVERQLIDYRQHDANQIGVKKPTLAYKAGRMLEGRGSRYRLLRERSDTLVERLESLRVGEQRLKLARDKARFESIRAELPAARWGRLGPVLREFFAGSYRRLSSQGDLDVFRDLLQPAARSTDPLTAE